MPRPPSNPTPSTALGVAIIACRGGRSGREAAAEIGIDQGMLSRLETGARSPSAQTARALARWLGWTTDQVLDAAGQPASAPSDSTPPQPPPPPPLGRTALRLPDGRLLAPWSELSPGTWQRAGGAPYSILVDAHVARLRLKGLDYTEAEPGRTIEERQALLDAWLLAQGATRSPPLATQ